MSKSNALKNTTDSYEAANCLHDLRAFLCNRRLCSGTEGLSDLIRRLFRISIQDGIKLYYPQVKFPHKWSWKVYATQKLQYSVQRQTVLGMYEQENIRNNGQPCFSGLKTTVRRYIDQVMRGVTKRNNRPSPALKRRHRLTGRYPSKVQAVNVKALLGREAEYRAKIFREESARIRHVTCGTPCVTITILNPARMVKNVNSDMLRLMASPANSVALLKESIQIGCVSHDSDPRKLFLRKENWEKTHRQILQGNVAPHQYSGKKRSYARSSSKVWTSRAQPVRSQVCGEDTRWNFASRKSSPRSSMEFGEKCHDKIKNTKKRRFTFVFKPGKQKKW